jgi:hypothetical protein
MASALINGLTDTIRKHAPEFKLKYKDESLFMKLLGLLTYPFNQAFMEGFITTIGMSVYFPSRSSLDGRGDGAAATMAHEFVHMWDSKKQWLRYNLGYLSPQILFIPLLAAFAIVGSWIPVASVVGGLAISYLALWVTMKATNDKGEAREAKEKIRKIRLGVFYTFFVVSIGGYVALSVWLSGWWTFLAVGAFLPLGPWPSPWRSKWEYRGYGMSIAWHAWRDGSISDRRMTSIAQRFTGMDYFRMDPNKGRVARRLNDSLVDAKNGEVLVGEDAEPYRVMHDYLSSGGLLRANQ